LYKFTISCSILLTIRNISKEIAEKIKIHILSSVTFSENPAVYEIKWKNTVQQDRPQMTI
jgi:hypothetical protein